MKRTLGLERLERRDLLAAGLELLRDINTDTVSSSPTRAVESGGFAYFAAESLGHGRELWRSDGTDAGTVLVRDIMPGRDGSNPVNLTHVNGTLFFLATDAGGQELWKTDGTTEGTVRVRDIYVGEPGSDIGHFFDFNNELYFVATSADAGREIWKTDGTTTGTSLIKDISPGAGSSVPLRGISSSFRMFTEFQGAVYFAADDGTHGTELWRTDGSASGTYLVSDLVAGPQGSNPRSLTQHDGVLYFVADDRLAGEELWKTDGTSAGTQLVADIQPGPRGSEIGPLYEFQQRLFFFADDGIHGCELWQSDGTPAGTELVRDIRRGSTGSSCKGSFLATANGELFFVASDGWNGRELWSTDGTTLGTSMVKNIRPGLEAGASIGPAAVLGNRLFFVADNVLWTTDGTAYRTVRADEFLESEIDLSPAQFVTLNGSLYFIAWHRENGYRIWKTDGTPQGTGVASASFQRPPENLVVVNGQLFFSARDEKHGVELWRSDGTVDGTSLVRDIHVGTNLGVISPAYRVNDTLTFFGYNRDDGATLWASDGTRSGTRPLGDVGVRYGRIRSDQILRSESNDNDVLYFAGTDDEIGNELWQSDGTVEGTSRVADIHVGPLSSNPSYLTAVAGDLYFFAADEDHGHELWISDGTSAGTRLVKDVTPGPASVFSRSPRPMMTSAFGKLYFRVRMDGGYALWQSDGTENGTFPVWGAEETRSIGEIAAVGSTLFFVGYDSEHGREIWSLDASGESTLVRDIIPGPEDADPRSLVEFQGQLYFRAGGTLWKSDGTPGGTLPLFDESPFSFGSDLTVSANLIYFAGRDLLHGAELWRSDGTAAGTQLVADIRPGPESSSIYVTQTWVSGDGSLYFNADDGQHGEELWHTDGTPGGTTLVDDIAPGQESSRPSFVTEELGRLFVVATTDEYGTEIWTQLTDPWRADFSGDGTLGIADVDMLVAEIARGTNATELRLTVDDLVDASDLDTWLHLAAVQNLDPKRTYLRGDANLDGAIDATDFGVWNQNRFTAAALWSRGDFNADGVVDGSDFNFWQANAFVPAPDEAVALMPSVSNRVPRQPLRADVLKRPFVAALNSHATIPRSRVVDLVSVDVSTRSLRSTDSPLWWELQAPRDNNARWATRHSTKVRRELEFRPLVSLVTEEISDVRRIDAVFADEKCG